MAMGIKVSAKATGPLLENPAVSERVQAAIDDTVRVVTEIGMQRLTSARPAGVPVKTGNYRRNVHPTIYGPTAQIDDGGVVYGPWLEGTSSRNETTRFKGYATFRRTAHHLRSNVVPGLVATAVEKLARELGG